MANRLNAPNQFETLSPPWILSQLDANATQNQAAWNDSSLGFMNGLPTDTGSANAYLITLTLGVPSSYRAGMCASFIPANSNTGPSTLTVSPLGSAAIVNPSNIALNGGEIIANRKVDLIHDGTSFRMIGTCPLNTVAGGLSGNTAIECAGFTSVTAYLTWTGGAAMAVSLNHLAQGVPVNIVALNNIGAAHAFLMSATDPAGNAFTLINAIPSATAGVGVGFTNLLAGGTTINNGIGIKLSGAAPAPLTLFLSI
jgi:hypothetical protein